MRAREGFLSVLFCFAIFVNGDFRLIITHTDTQTHKHRILGENAFLYTLSPLFIYTKPTIFIYTTHHPNTTKRTHIVHMISFAIHTTHTQNKPTPPKPTPIWNYTPTQQLKQHNTKLHKSVLVSRLVLPFSVLVFRFRFMLVHNFVILCLYLLIA